MVGGVGDDNMPQAQVIGRHVIWAPAREDNFWRLSYLDLEDICMQDPDRPRILILNYPSNPVGSVYSVENLTQIGKLAVEHNLYIVSDEMYEKLVYDGYKHTSTASIDNAFRERTIISNGVSKAYSMTGWRIGYTVGKKEIISAMSNIQSQSTSNPTSISQYAALAALTGPQDFISVMVNEFQKRRDYLIRELTGIPGVTCYNPKGAFYAFPNIAVTGMDDETFAQKLLEEERVAVVPGNAFGPGGEGYVRCSYATSYEKIEEALRRIEKFMHRHG